MAKETSAADFLPKQKSLTALRRAADSCKGCDLYKDATQTVFGEGPRKASIMIVGEMPGDHEDLEGKPFVGPAGRLLNEGLQQAGLERKEAYVTNAVKHFRWEERGKRRLHKKPRWSEVQACKPWLLAELMAVKPKLILCLGATAAQSLVGPDFRITKKRGQPLECEWADCLIATYHPSAILRAPDPDKVEAMRREFFDDLRRAAKQLAG